MKTDYYFTLGGLSLLISMMSLAGNIIYSSLFIILGIIFMIIYIYKDLKKE